MQQPHLLTLPPPQLLKQWLFRPAAALRDLLAKMRRNSLEEAESSRASPSEPSDNFCNLLLQARQLLEQAIGSSHQAVELIATHFQSVAALSGEVCELTSQIIERVQKDCSSIVAALETMRFAIRSALSQNVAAISALAEVFDAEAEMTTTLKSLIRDAGVIAREGKVLRLFAAVEVARMGDLGGGFDAIVHELDTFAEFVSSGTARIYSRAEERRPVLAGKQRAIEDSGRRLKELFERVDSELNELVPELNRAMKRQTRIPEDFRCCVGTIADKSTRIISAVQAEDITRQQAEHVCQALAVVMREAQASSMPGLHDKTRHLALLKIQAAQMLYVKRSMEQQISQIGDCTDAILHLSTSDLVAMSAESLEQDQRLRIILERVAALERDSKADQAKIDLFLNELDGVSEMVNTHLTLSRDARQRMHLLNLNAVIAADRLGAQARALVEIAHNVSRVSSDWAALTTRTEATMARITSALLSARQVREDATPTDGDALASAQKETRRQMVSMRGAAAASARDNARVDSTIKQLHREIEEVSAVTERVREAVLLVERAIDLLCCAQSTCSSHELPELTDADLRQLEVHCESAYTTELERQILRSTLYGEPAPVPIEESAIGNEVELF